MPLPKVGKIGQGFSKSVSYDAGVLAQTDKFHNFPVSFDKYIIKNGTWSQRLSDRANWYELQGLINEERAIYQIESIRIIQFFTETLSYINNG